MPVSPPIGRQYDRYIDTVKNMANIFKFGGDWDKLL